MTAPARMKKRKNIFHGPERKTTGDGLDVAGSDIFIFVTPVVKP